MSGSDGTPPGPLLGRGRAADVYDLGNGRVLRRNRRGESTALEAQIMQHVHAHGYPVPEVFDAEAGDLVMERLDGPTMLQAFGSRPWTIRRSTRMLADLHIRLEGVPLPDFELRVRSGAAEAIVHGDLHPDNVILTERGPAVIDWPNSALGPRGADAANTWVTMASAELEGGRVERTLQSWGRNYFVRSFVNRTGRTRLRAQLGAAADHKLLDRNLRPAEAQAIRALVRQETAHR